MSRHRAKEFLKFLRQIERAVQDGRAVHLVLDKYATHKTPEVNTWMDKYPRFTLHFTPTSASWINLLERFFDEITARRIRRGSCSNVEDLEASINDCLLFQNAKPSFCLEQNRRNIIARECRAVNTVDKITGNR